MSLPYLPLYIDDYEAATAHLTLVEDGAYNRLLRLLWRSPNCSIPDDDAWVFRRLRAVSDEEKAAILTVIDEFLQRKAGLITSPRLLREFKKADETSRKRSEAGKKGGRPKAIEKTDKEVKPGFSFDKARQSIPEPEPEPDIYGGGGGSAYAREADPISEHQPEPFRVQLLAAMGIGPDGIVGPSKFIGGQGDMAEAKRWLDLPGMTEGAILAEIRALTASKQDGPPKSFRYFTAAMQRLSGQLTAKPLQPTAGMGARASPAHSEDQLAASIARLEQQGRI